MSLPYEEMLDGIPTLRLAPDARHEDICARLHGWVRGCVADVARLLPPRDAVQVASHLTVRPDLAIVAVANGRLWLAAEVISAYDHEPDTVVKKALYEDLRLARLWMIDPRYDNVEVYHGTEFGLMLKGILAGREHITERLLPGFRPTIEMLFASGGPVAPKGVA